MNSDYRTYNAETINEGEKTGRKYFVVINPGTDKEEISGRAYMGSGEPYKAVNRMREAFPDSTFDVMKNVDGKLTTDF